MPLLWRSTSRRRSQVLQLVREAVGGNVTALQSLASNPGEPAGPSILYYGAAVNLHLDVLKELVERAAHKNEKLTWVNEYNHFLSFYGANLNQEFIKGAAERVDKTPVVVDDSQTNMGPYTTLQMLKEHPELRCFRLENPAMEPGSGLAAKRHSHLCTRCSRPVGTSVTGEPRNS